MSSSFFATNQFVALLKGVPTKIMVVLSATSVNPVPAVDNEVNTTLQNGSDIFISKTNTLHVTASSLMVTLNNITYSYLLI